MKIEIVPIEGMDLDSDDRYIANGDYTYALNIRNTVSEEGEEKVLTNVKGNTLVPYNLPAGTNKVIGAFEDAESQSVIIFIWNSNNLHRVAQYRLGVITTVIEYNFGWNVNEEITGANLINSELLKWVDSVKPRGFNIKKAILTGKTKVWDVFLPVDYVQPFQTFGYSIVDKAGVQIFAGFLSFTTPLDREATFLSVANQINNSPAVAFISAEACGCSLTITEVLPDYIGNVVFGGNASYKVVPNNWYGVTLIDEFFDAAKYPPVFEPIAIYKKDPTKAFNFVQNRAFQFRLQFLYDDNDESALSPISEVPINNTGYVEQFSDAFNYIEIDFNNPPAFDPNIWVVLKKVKVLERELNTGVWRQIRTLDICDFYYVAGAKYDFYNNVLTSAIDDALAAKAYDNIPRQAQAQEFVKNRLVYGNILQNYDAPDCVEAQIGVNVADNPNQQTYTVSLNIRVFNHQLDNKLSPINRRNIPNILERSGGIFVRTELSEFPVYGGAFFANSVLYLDNNPPNTNISPVEKAIRNDQLMPEGGWPVYLAGTDLFGISRQVSRAALPQTSDAVIELNSAGARTRARDYFTARQTNPLPTNDLYSTVTIKNVPNGTYVIRLASHLCSFGDKLDKGNSYDLSLGRGYQGTSTNVWGVVDANGTYTATKELTITVNNGNVFAGEVIVCDLVNYSQNGGGLQGQYYIAATGYVIDSLGNTNIPALQRGVTVEKCLVRQSEGNNTPIGIIPTPPNPNTATAGNTCFTDCNGYFYVFEMLSFLDTSFTVYSVNQVLATPTIIRNAADIIYYGISGGTSALELLATGEIASTYDYGVVTSFDMILPTSLSTARDTCSTFVQGTLVDANGIGVSGINVVYENGRATITDTNGAFKLIAWGDMLGINEDGNLNNRIVDALVFSPPLGLTAVFTIGNPYGIAITAFGANTGTPPPYSPQAPYDTGGLLISISSPTIIKARKRGGSYCVGIKYYDNVNRESTVIFIDNVYVPFTTEDLGKYLSNYPLGTYKQGAATFTFNITSAPPIWAWQYQFVITLNNYQGTYLQWVANNVTYLAQTAYVDANFNFPDIPTSYGNFNAIAIKISISNIVDYKRVNNNSLVSYTYQVGDRLRLIADADFNYQQGLAEYEIIGYEQSTQSLIVKTTFALPEIKTAAYLEIYSVKKLTDETQQSYFEFGECFPCTAPGQPNNAHSVPSGTFSGGDTYWRPRIIPISDDANNIGGVVPIIIEDASISDFYSSKIADIGRIGFIDPNFRELLRPTLMQNSNSFLVGTNINGLSQFEALNEKELPRSYGAIRKLLLNESTLASIHESKIVANYINQQFSVDTTTESDLISISSDFFGNDRPLNTVFGTQHPSTVTLFKSIIRGVDVFHGVVWQYDNNGVDVISDRKAKAFFRRLTTGVITAVGAIDPYRQEYIVTIDNGTKSTVAYSTLKLRWTTFYSHTPERYASLGNNLLSFVSGALWLHDTNPVRNNFYGTQYTSKLTIVANAENAQPKVFDAIGLEQRQVGGGNNWGLPIIRNKLGQLSRLFASAFVKKEQHWYTNFKRDLNTVSVTNPILNGKNLRSVELTMEMENDATSEVILKGVLVKFTDSNLM